MAKKLYQVKGGDTLRNIAQRILGDESRWQELAYINSLSQPYIIKAGQVLMVPSNDEPIEILVEKGQKPVGPPAPARLPGPTAPATDPFMLYAMLAIGAAAWWILSSDGRG